MTIYIVEVCGCSEYGTMSFWGAYTTEEAAHAAAQAAGLQNEDEGGDWSCRTDYYEVREATLHA